MLPVLLALSCEGPPQSAAVTEGAATDGSGGTPATARELPPGHPPISSAQPESAIPAPTPDAGAGEMALVWDVPEGWIEEEPSNRMRRAQYRVPASSGAASCVVFYFGAGQGGEAMANALRWAGQFRRTDGTSAQETLETEWIEVGGLQVLLSEVHGTYSGGMTMMGGPAQNLEGHMLLGAIAEGPDANWFFKLTGPEGTVEAQRGAFEAMIRSLRRGT